MKKSKLGCDLNSCMFCRTCLNEWRPAINAHRQTYTVKKGQTIFSEGDTVTGIFFVVEGAVKVHKKWEEEKELIVRFAKKGAIVGHRGLGSESIYPISATAIEASTVCFIDINFFFASLKVNHQFLFELMMFFADELRLSERKMRNMAHMPVKGRIATALLSLRDNFGTNAAGYIDITLSRQDLASYAGTTYETVFRVINELSEANVITTSDKDIAIIDIEGLQRIADNK